MSTSSRQRREQRRRAAERTADSYKQADPADLDRRIRWAIEEGDHAQNRAKRRARGRHR